MALERTVVWFSCGAASAVAAHLVIQQATTPVEVVYCDTSANEHHDNARFFSDVERWLGVPIKRISNPKYGRVEEVFAARKYMAGIAGAPCTVEMKKIPRFAFQRADDVHVFGYTSEEQPRITRFEQANPELALRWVLRDAGYSKADCLRTLAEAGIAIPAMYLMGYNNNNCIGCVKASSTKYWNSIRRDFPDVFDARAEMSRNIGARLTRVKGRRIFLDELPNDHDDGIIENVSCGPECADEAWVE